MASQPIQNLLEFYKGKSHEIEKDYAKLGKKIDDIQKQSICQIDYWKQLKEKNDEILRLQALINNVDICILKEKENVLRLTSENDQLRIKNISFKQRIKELEIVLFDENSKTNSSGYISNTTQAQNLSDQTLQIKALNLQIQDQRRFITNNLEKIMLKQKEFFEQAAIPKEDSQQKNMVKRLSSTQELLCQTAKDYAELKCMYYKNQEIYQVKETALQTQIQELRSQLKHLRFASNEPNDDHIKNDEYNKNSEDPNSLQLLQRLGISIPSTSTGSNNDVASTVHKNNKTLEKKLKLAQDGVLHYKQEILELENEYELLSEKFEAERSIYTERNEALIQKNKALEQKYQNLERRRNFDRQGYQTDIALLKDKLKQLEKMLYKATISLGNDTKNKEILDNLEKIAEESKKLIADEKQSRIELLDMEERLKEKEKLTS